MENKRTPRREKQLRILEIQQLLLIDVRAEIRMQSEKVTLSRQEIVNLRNSLPTFFQLKNELSHDSFKRKSLLYNFFTYVIQNRERSYSQLFQDLFVEFLFAGKRGGRFLEFGATDGHSLSNSLLLEEALGWTGVLAEPDPQWHQRLRANRPTSSIVTDCIHHTTGLEIDFISSGIGELSTMAGYENTEEGSYSSGNVNARLSAFNRIKVTTFSLNDLFEQYFDGAPIEYMSVDTEGSEVEILSAFNFEKFGPAIVSVEHNHTENQSQLDALFSDADYVRLFRQETDFDAWFVKRNFFAPNQESRDRNLAGQDPRPS